jgi:hypothetical protein
VREKKVTCVSLFVRGRIERRGNAMLGGILLGGRIKSFILVFGLVILGVAGFGQDVTAATTRTYTVDADFDEGILVGVEHETTDHQLQLSQELVTLPFHLGSELSGHGFQSRYGDGEGIGTVSDRPIRFTFRG